MSSIPDVWATSNDDHNQVGASVNDGAANTGQTVAPAAPKSKKATKHRKRHIPVGPAGVLFQQTQTQQQQQRPGAKRPRVTGVAGDKTCGKNSHSTTENHPPDENSNSSSDDEGSISTSRRNHDRHHPHRSPRTVSASAYTSPAWTAAQCALQLSTPSCPFHWTTLQKYETLRPQLPPEYLLISELRNGAADWHMAPSQKLLVQILTVQAVTGSNDHLWTVTLTDECGATIQAWLSPEWVRQEQQQTLVQQKIRTGSLWLLQNCTVQLIASNHHSITNVSAEEEDEEEEEQQQHDRMLLVALENVVQVWHSNASVTNDEYILWMEARNALTADIMSRSWNNHPTDPSSQLASEDDDEAGPQGSILDHSTSLNLPIPPSLFVPPVPHCSTRLYHQQRQLPQDQLTMQGLPVRAALSQQPMLDNWQQRRTDDDDSRPAAAGAVVSHSQQASINVNNHIASCPGPSRLLNQNDRQQPMDTPLQLLTRTTTTTAHSYTSPAALSLHGTTQSIDLGTLRADEAQATCVATQHSPAADGHSRDPKPTMQPTNSSQSLAARLPQPPTTATKQIDTATQPRTKSSQKQRQQNETSLSHPCLQKQPLWSTANPASFLLHCFSSDEDGDDDLPGQAFSDVRQYATGAPQRQPRAKENDPPEKLAGDIDVHATNDNHHTKPSVALLFQESAYAKLGDLDDMFDDDDDD